MTRRRKTLEELGWTWSWMVASQLFTCVLGVVVGLTWGLGWSDLGERLFCTALLAAWFAFNFWLGTIDDYPARPTTEEALDEHLPSAPDGWARGDDG